MYRIVCRQTEVHRSVKKVSAATETAWDLDHSIHPDPMPLHVLFHTNETAPYRSQFCGITSKPVDMTAVDLSPQSFKTYMLVDMLSK